jgi:hypothetical protein
MVETKVRERIGHYRYGRMMLVGRRVREVETTTDMSQPIVQLAQQRDLQRKLEQRVRTSGVPRLITRTGKERRVS